MRRLCDDREVGADDPAARVGDSCHHRPVVNPRRTSIDLEAVRRDTIDGVLPAQPDRVRRQYRRCETGWRGGDIPHPFAADDGEGENVEVLFFYSTCGL